MISSLSKASFNVFPVEMLCGVPDVVVGKAGRLWDALQRAVTLLNRVTLQEKL